MLHHTAPHPTPRHPTPGDFTQFSINQAIEFELNITCEKRSGDDANDESEDPERRYKNATGASPPEGRSGTDARCWP